jgi:hypothetical protein
VIPELDLAAIRDYCEQGVPPEARDQVRVEAHVAQHTVTMIERRPPWRDDAADWSEHPVARLRYTAKSNLWALSWRDRNERWHRYQTGPVANVRGLLDEIDSDPTGIFWG